MSLVLYEVTDKTATITLNRPDKLNAYTEEMVDEMYEACQRFAKDDDAWTAIVTGAGDRAFCAGHDLNLVVESKGQYEDHGSPTVWYGEFEIYKPMIAAVNGYAFGGGCSLALSCDIRIASENAVFGYPQPKYGAMSLGGHQRMPKTIPPGIAMEFMLTGRHIPADEAARWGMVNKVVSQDKLMDEALRYARAVAAHSTDNLMLGRKSMNMFFRLLGVDTYFNYAEVAHPLFTNMVWREDEHNFLRERNKYGNKEGMRRLNAVWEDLGFK